MPIKAIRANCQEDVVILKDYTEQDSMISWLV